MCPFSFMEGVMDLYNIPNDDGKRYRKQVFLSMLEPEKGYIDGATDYCMLMPFSKQFGLNTEEKLWLSFLYGLTYSQTSAMRVFIEFPDLGSINLNALRDFWGSEKSTLYFSKDKLRIKNNDQFIPSIMSMKSKLVESESSFEQLYAEHDTFERLYKWVIKEWRFFGPHGAYLFFDSVYGLLPKLYKDPNKLDWKNCGKTVAQGMSHLLYLDELSSVSVKEHNLSKYDNFVNKLQDRSNQPKIIIESTLCAFRKLFKGTRYSGYYADRMLEEVSESLKSVPTFWRENGIDLYEYRAKSIPECLRGETQGWSGIRQERMRDWLDKGVLRWTRE